MMEPGTGLQDLLATVAGLGAAAGPLFGILFWLERGERKELARAKDAMTERALVSITETGAALNALKSILGK
jgi:hypothetical protein